MKPHRSFTTLVIAGVLSASTAAAQRGGYHGPAESPNEGLSIPAAITTDHIPNQTVPINRSAAEALEHEIRRTGGAALAIFRDNTLVHLWSDGDLRPIELMSATKSVAAIAVGTLLDDGLIESIDQPVRDLFPEFVGNGREAITIRMLLNHTSGLGGATRTPEIYAADDVLAYALGASIVSEPGQAFAYNNNATNLLMGVIGRAAGRPADEYIAERVLAPLGIRNWSWFRGPSGNPHGMAGLKLDAIDAGRVGVLVLNRGVFLGRRVVSDAWFDTMLTSGTDLYPRVGLLWWRRPADAWDAEIQTDAIETLIAGSELNAEIIEALRGIRPDAAPRSELLAQLESILGRETLMQWRQRASDQGLQFIRESDGPTRAYYADGYLGQFIFVVPEERLVVVRQQTNRQPPEPLDLDQLWRLVDGLTDP
ncbi:MAG: serine hydrolase domain-containing protein [Planctomycetota bacterium]